MAKYVMVDIKINELKMINARYAENVIGLSRPSDQDPSVNIWDVRTAYMVGVADEHHWALQHKTECRALDWIARLLEPGSLAVEVGCFLGCSAAIMANANAQIKVIGLDLFDQPGAPDSIQGHYQRKYQQLIDEFLAQPNSIRSLDRVSQRLSHYTNLEFRQGRNPEDFAHTELENIDLFFEDADHSTPRLRMSLDHWLPRVRSGGLVLLHDYKPWLPKTHDYKINNWPNKRFPDVELECHRLIQEGYRLEGTVHSLAILRKP